MPVSNQTQSYVTRRTPAEHLTEIRRRVAKRGGMRHVQGGALKLRMPKDCSAEN